MEVFINASPGFGHARDIVEDAIEEFLDGRGEVTGGGGGTTGSNVDIEVFDGQFDLEELLAGLRKLMVEFDVPVNSSIVIDGVKHAVYS